MFNLNQEIIEWRKRMAAGGIKTPAVLDELENHLREDVQRQVESGADEKISFHAAERRIGKSDLLKAEFAKVAGTKEARAGKVIGVACGLVALPLSVLAVPTFLTVRELPTTLRLLGSGAVILTLLSIASWRFSYRFLPVIRNRSVRSITAVGCGLAGLAWLILFGALLPTVLVPHWFVRADVSSPDGLAPVFAMGVSLLWAMALTAVLGGVAYALDRAARRHTKENAYV